MAFARPASRFVRSSAFIHSSGKSVGSLGRRSLMGSKSFNNVGVLFSTSATGATSFDVPPSNVDSTADPFNNTPPSVIGKINRNLHLKPAHPLNTIKSIISDHFASTDGLKTFDSFSPLVPTSGNFDSLLIPEDHPGRQPSDTYYITPTQVLRTHTSAHQQQVMEMGERKFLVVGDCYRRDEIDYCHYPVFHQVEGVKLFDMGVTEEEVVDDLKKR